MSRRRENPAGDSPGGPMEESTPSFHPLSAYLPRWLLGRLSAERVTPGWRQSQEAAVLFADMASFTLLTEAMAQRGPQGVEVLSRILETVFANIVDTVQGYGGDIARFFGDAVTAIWPLPSEEDSTPLLQALTAAQAVQGIMGRFNRVSTPSGPMPLTMRVGIGCGPLTLMVVGSVEQQRPLLTGPALLRAAEAEMQAPHGQITLHESVHRRLGEEVVLDVDGRFLHTRSHVSPSPLSPPPGVPVNLLRPFIHPALVERVESGQGEFLADFRHGVVPLFVSFAADDPDALQAYVAQTLAVIGPHGGYLSEVDVADKGNVLTVLFGVPLSQGDNNARAAACALDLAALPATQTIGATSGTLFAGVVGSERRRQYTTFGDEMNLACRLMETAQQYADRPVILVGARVRRQAGPRFAYGGRQELHVKGKSEPVAVLRLMGRTDRRGDWLTPWLRKDPLIGRQEELALLDAQIGAAMAGESRLLTIVGEAGVGKSSITSELLRRWIHRGSEAYVGAALSSAQHSPYHAWGELLRAFFDLRGEPGDAARVEATITAVDPDFALRLPLLSDVIGLGLPDNDLTRHFDAHLRQQSTQALLIDLFHHHAARSPLLLILEDAHWLDQLSWEMALAVARALHDLPVLLCVVHRPLDEPLPEAYRSLTGLGQRATLELKELSPDEAVALACARLGVAALPDELAALVQEKAQGHPFFTEEIIYALQNRGVIQVRNDRVVVLDDLAQTDLPDTVQGVVQARIDQLDEQVRLTLKVASVIGRAFPFRTLADVHPLHLPDAELRDQLDLLERLDITPLDRPDPEPVYIFKHAITQEVTYGSLLFSQRRRLHTAVAEWYERTYADRPEGLSPYFSLLAYHYGHTGREEKQVYYLERLARQAHDRYAADVAIAAYEQLVTILDGWEQADEEARAAYVAGMLDLDPRWGEEAIP